LSEEEDGAARADAGPVDQRLQVAVNDDLVSELFEVGHDSPIQ